MKSWFNNTNLMTTNNNTATGVQPTDWTSFTLNNNPLITKSNKVTSPNIDWTGISNNLIKGDIDSSITGDIVKGSDSSNSFLDGFLGGDWSMEGKGGMALGAGQLALGLMSYLDNKDLRKAQLSNLQTTNEMNREKLDAWNKRKDIWGTA